MDVTPLQSERYTRQSLLPEVGLEGQDLLLQKRVLVVGAGGLGAPILYYLVAAGLGHIGIVDGDTVSLSNLQRQILYTEQDIGKPKATTAAQRLRALNSDCTLTPYNMFLTEQNAREIAQGYDLLVDGCDNNRTRYLMDTTAAQLHIPYLYGAVSHFVGQCSLFHYGTAGAYRDLFPSLEVEAEAETIPVIGALPGIVGATMALEAIKALLGIGTTLDGKLLRIDALSLETHCFTIAP